MNKIRHIISGISHGEINRMEVILLSYRKKILKNCRVLRVIYIKKMFTLKDDIVIMINVKGACLHFYGDEKIAWSIY